MAMDFRLSDDFVNTYRDKPVPWGYQDAAGNSLGEITYLRTYSRKNEITGEKETWVDTCRRVIEGMFTIQKHHCRQNHIEWKNDKAQRTAKDAFDRLFHMKWLPSGRGLWAMGSPLVMDDNNSAPLQSCAFISTEHSVIDAMTFLFDASMLGVGVGFDADGAGKFYVTQPRRDGTFIIPDSREGWVESLRILLAAYMPKEFGVLPEFDYSQIRAAGEPIKRFGGVASGPEPLKRMHALIKEILDRRAGQAITMTDIADIGNIIGTCVVAGNVRRSAEIFFVDRESADFEDFLNLKNYGQNPHRESFGWMSNNSVRVNVGDDLSPLAEGIMRNGEPGMVWMDTTRNYGRLVDGPDYKDVRVKGYNPSLVAGTKVYTTEGIKEIQDLENKYFKVRNLNGNISDAYCWKSGVDEEVLKVSLAGGHEYTATPKHKWPVWNGTGWEKRRTDELKVGDKLPNLAMGNMFPEGTKGTYDEGFLIGWNLGDGWITRRPGGLQIGFMVGPNDRESGIDTKLEGILHDLGSSANFVGKDEINVNNSSVRELFSSFDVRHKSEGLPKSVWDAGVSDEFRRGLIDALFSADGTVDGNRISFSQASEKMVRDVASLLGFFGVQTSISTLDLAASAAFPEKYTEDHKDIKFTRWTLRIGEKSNIDNFVKSFTLTHAAKQGKIDAYLNKGTFNRKPTNWYIEITGVAEAGTADVWDVTVEDETHAFQIDHCVTGNCVEQPLESGETCNLVETFVNNCTDRDDFIKTLKVAYLYGKTVTLLPTKWEQTNTIMQRNRRIGLSASGVADFVDRHGMAELRDMLDDGFKYILKRDAVYSEWLCVRESIRHTTMKPSGSISLLAGSSPGVHWTPGGEYFIRRITFSIQDPLFAALKTAGYEHAELEYDKNSAVILFPIHSRSKRSSTDVPAWEKIHLASEVQYWWSDNAVSCTVDFDKGTESKDIPTLLAMYDGKLKGISFLPQVEKGAFKNMPYEKITVEEFEAMAKTISKADYSAAYRNGAEAEGEKYCSTDVCEIKTEILNSDDETTEPIIDIAALIGEK